MLPHPSSHHRFHPLGLVFAFLSAFEMFPASVSAGIARMSWDECAIDGGVQQRTFACDANTGSNHIVGTFTLTEPIADFIGVEVVVDLQSTAPALPEWWKFWQSGSCRQNALNASFDWSVLAGGCADAYGGTVPQGGIAGYFYLGGPIQSVDNPTDPTRARLKIAAAVQASVAVAPDIEYYAYRLTMTNVKSTGTGSCAGCLEPMCLVVNSIKAAGLSGPYVLNLPSQTDPGSAVIGWQCAGWWWGTPYGGCYAPIENCSTPARNNTWGQIKGLYR